MRVSIARLLVISTLILIVCGLVQAAGEIFSLTINTPQDTVGTGSDIQLMIKLANETNHDIMLVDRDQVCDYMVEVRDSNGQSVPETDQRRKRKCTDPVVGKLIMLKLKPGEHHEYLIFVGDLFDMTRPDKYKVQVAREIPKELGQGQVRSNTITVTVTD
jgi:hypothetical protein